MSAAHRLACALAIACLPACAGEPWRKTAPTVDREFEVALPQLVRAELPSKLSVISARNADAGLLHVSLVLRGGYDEDPRGKEGLARLAADVLETSAHSPGNAERFGALGGTPVVVATRRALIVAIEVMPTDGLAATQALSEFLSAEVDVPALLERARIAQGRVLSQSVGSPDRLASLAIARLFPPARGSSHAFGLGSAVSLAAITADDVGLYMRRAVDPREAAFVVTGPLDSAEVSEWAADAFRDWPALPARPQPPGLGRSLARDDRIVFVPMPGMKQALVVIGGLRPHPGDPESVPFAAALDVLQSRIWSDLREELRISYGITGTVLAEDDVFVVAIRVRADKTRLALARIREAMDSSSAMPAPGWFNGRRLSESVRLMDEAQDSGRLAQHARGVFEHGLDLHAMQGTLDALQRLDGAAAQASARSYLRAASLRLVVVGDPQIVRRELPRNTREWAPETLVGPAP